MRRRDKLIFLFKFVTVLVLLSALFTISLLMSERIYWYLFYFFSALTVISLFILGRRVLTLKSVSSTALIFNEGMGLKASFSLEKITSSAFLQGRLSLGEKDYPLISLKKEGIINYQLEDPAGLPRGIYNDGALTFLITDWFGLFQWQKKIPLATPLVVLPRYLPEESQALWQELDKLLHLTDSFGLRSHELKNLRTYQTGDHFRQIDWKLSAKGEELVVKEFEPEVDRQFKFIFLGTDGESFERLLALFYSFWVDYQGDLGPESLYLVGNGEITESPTDLVFAALKGEQDSVVNLTSLTQKQFIQQQLIFFIPTVTDELIESLLPLSVYNQVSIISYQTDHLVIQGLTTFGAEEGIG